MLKQFFVNINELIKLSRCQKIYMTFLMFTLIMFCKKHRKKQLCVHLN